MKVSIRLAALAAAFLLPACGSSSSDVALVLVSSSQLSFTGPEAGADPADQTVVLTAQERLLHRQASWTAVTDQPWLSVTPVSGTTASGQSETLSIHVDLTMQAEGWTGPTSLVGAPFTDVNTIAGWGAWTGTRMLIFRGPSTVSARFYDPVSDTWSGSTSVVGAPSDRSSFTAVWTGTEVIVWGGHTLTGPMVALDTGARYNPSTNTWTTMSTVGAPSARSGHRAVWTGQHMIIWGGDGLGFTYTNTGALYDPATDTWVRPTSTVNAPTPRGSHAAVWTGTDMLVWGGENPGKLNDGRFYNPDTDTWSGATTPVGAPSARSHLQAVWTGSEMVFWGGATASVQLDTGFRYSPELDSWVPLPMAGVPQARSSHNVVWTGNRVIAWGGVNTTTNINTGGLYQPPIPPRGSHTGRVTVTAFNGPIQSTHTITVLLTVTP